MKRTIQMARVLAMAAFITTVTTNYAEEYREDYSDPPPPVPFQNGPYLGLHLGPAFPGGDSAASFDAGFAISTQVGYKLDMLRAEGEFSYFRNPANSHTPDIALELTTYMLNGYYDFYPTNKIIPFLGFGMGLAHSWVPTSGGTTDPKLSNHFEDEFAYQFLMGTGYLLQPKITLTFRYRYVAFYNYGHSAENGFEFGVNYAF